MSNTITASTTAEAPAPNANYIPWIFHHDSSSIETLAGLGTGESYFSQPRESYFSEPGES